MSSHHPQEVLLAQFNLYVHKGGLKPDLLFSFRIIRTRGFVASRAGRSGAGAVLWSLPPSPPPPPPSHPRHPDQRTPGVDKAMRTAQGGSRNKKRGEVVLELDVRILCD